MYYNNFISAWEKLYKRKTKTIIYRNEELNLL